MKRCPFYKSNQKVCKACVEGKKISFVANPIGLYQWHRDNKYCLTRTFISCTVYRKSLEKGWKPKIEVIWCVS